MLLLTGLIYLVQSSEASSAAPLSFSERSVDIDVMTSCACPDPRSLLNILWSCLATIFACSWISVHPNIPGPDETRPGIALRRLELMCWALIAPEMIIYWAMRQWFGARKLAKQWHGKGWTKTHGYFVQMGGFMLYKGNQAQGVLSPKHLEDLYDEGKIAFPNVSEKEIKDHSKADALSKAFVIGQTTWFIVQCLARVIQGLDLTQLELLTVAFAFLNGFMYFLWWNKPLDVQCHVPVFLLDKVEEHLMDEPARTDGPSESPAKTPFYATAMTAVKTFFHTAPLTNEPRISSLLPRKPSPVKYKGWLGILHTTFILFPVRLVVAVYSRLNSMWATRYVGTHPMRMPTFFAAETSELENRKIVNAVSAVAVAFGAIHCAGWRLTFPSHLDAWVWRASSIIISAVPPLWAFADHLFYWWRYAERDSMLESLLWWVRQTIKRIFLTVLPLYVAARFALMIEAFIGLHVLTSGTLAVVKWTTFIPHI